MPIRIMSVAWYRWRRGVQLAFELLETTSWFRGWVDGWLVVQLQGRRGVVSSGVGWVVGNRVCGLGGC